MTGKKHPRNLPPALDRSLAHPTPACREIARLASESLDRPLTWRERLDMRLHYAICYLCRRYEDQLRLLHQGLAQNRDQFTASHKLTLSLEEKTLLLNACKAAAKAEKEKPGRTTGVES